MSENEKGKFIAIHGIDGTGKTSTTERVALGLKKLGVEAVNYDTLKDSLKNPHEGRKKKADKLGTLEDRIVAYLESMMYHSDNIQTLREKGFTVVKSRYLDDILAHFSHLGVNQEQIEELKKKFPLVQPDLKVILQLDEPERHRRIRARGKWDEKDLEEKKEGSRLGFFEDYLLEAAKSAPPNSILHINTGICNLEEVSQKIIDHILKGGNL